MVLLLALLFFGQAVAQGVTEEKSSRVVELLLTTVSPRRLLAGKILGVGVLGLALLFIPGAAALVAGSLARGLRGPALGGARSDRSDPAVVRARLCLLQRRVRGGGRARLPPRGPQPREPPGHRRSDRRFLSRRHRGQHQPNGTVARVAAFLPPLSPKVVPARMVLGDMTAVGLAISVVLEVVAIGGMIALAARTYERAILRIGAPVKLHRLFALRSQQPHGVRTTAKRHARPQGRGQQTGRPQQRPTATRPRDGRHATRRRSRTRHRRRRGRLRPADCDRAGRSRTAVLLIIDQTLKHLRRRPAH